jgi:hypothetical protein
MSIEKDFVPYQESFELKELGFDEPCLAYWYNETPTNPEGQCLVYYKKPWDEQKIINGIIRDYYVAPTFSQAFRFFREKYKLFVQPNRTIDSPGIWYYFYIETRRGDICEGSFIYEEAELACLRKLIEIVKQNND